MTSPDTTDDRTRLDPGRGDPPADGTRLDTGRGDGTRLDTGRGDGTRLDTGRHRAPVQPDGTRLDTGRGEPSPPPKDQPWGLPAELAERFRLSRELSSGGEGSLYVVQERATDIDRVLKVYNNGWAPDPQVIRYFLESRRSPHIVQMLESGESGGRAFEIMEFLTGQTLGELRRANAAGLPTDRIRFVVEQLTEALVELHAAGIVHRDVKPSNVIVRSLDPLEFVLVDIGISRWAPMSESFTRRVGTGSPRYRPPEYNAAGRISAEYDWWSLGITTFELATGRQMLDGIDDEVVINLHYAKGPVDVSGIEDERTRLLCRGLLTPDPDSRWGADEVQRWLAGESPPVAAATTTPRSGRTDLAATPYRYLDAEYWYRDELAAAMTGTWETAAAVLFGPDPEPNRELGQWLKAFPGRLHRPGRRRRTTDDVRLLDRLRTINPARPPVYRHVAIAADRLYGLSRGALAEEPVSAGIVNDLWEYDLLPDLAQAPKTPEFSGGGGLVEARDGWRRQFRRLTDGDTSAGIIADDAARAEFERLRLEEPARLRTVSLMAVAANAGERAEIRRILLQRAARAREPWFTALANQPQHLALALLLSSFADNAAQRKADEERAAQERRDWLRRNEALREWSRRQNRPRALSLAASGVVAMAVLLALMVGVSDAAERASDATIVDAWYAVVGSIALALIVESLLAWGVGGRFWPYSILVAGPIAVGRWARRVRGRWASLAVVLVIVLAAGLLTVYAPIVTPLAFALLMVLWTISRYLAWRDEAAQEQADIARAVRQEAP